MNIKKYELFQSWLAIYQTAIEKDVKSKAVQQELSNHAAMFENEIHEARIRAGKILFSLSPEEITERIKRLNGRLGNAADDT